MHMIHRTFPTFKQDYTEVFDNEFRPPPEIVAFHTYFVDPQYARHLYCDEILYNQDKFEYKYTHNKSYDQTGKDDLITDAHASDALRYAFLSLWTINPHLLDTSPLPNFLPRPKNQQRQIALIDDQTLPQL